MQTIKRLISCVALACAIPLPLPAQGPAPLGDARVTLIASDTTSRGGRTEVVRRAKRVPQNLVIVSRNATAEDLVAALTMISALRTQYGDSLDSDIRARPESVHPGETWQQSAYRSWVVRQLARLRTASQRNIADLGLVRAVQITLPAPKSASTSSAGARQ